MPSAIQASVVMARAAFFLNDAAQLRWTNTALLPALQAAYDELGEILEENNVPATNEVAANFHITATTVTDIGGTTGPALPVDLIEIQRLEERTWQSSEDFTEMVRTEFLPSYTIQTSDLIYWTWQNQIIQFIGATTDREVKISYVGLTIGTITGPASNIALFNAKTFLSYRTAALACEFNGENPSRADKLNSFALLAIERLENISAKGRQAIAVRRRPFMATYKSNRSTW